MDAFTQAQTQLAIAALKKLAEAETPIITEVTFDPANGGSITTQQTTLGAILAAQGIVIT